MNELIPSDSGLPRPRSRLWSTWLRRARDLRPFAPKISFDEVAQSLPPVEDAAHWGEWILLEDHASVLHRDGTITYGVHYISMLHGDMNLAGWEQVLWYYQPRMWRPTVHRALVRFPENGAAQNVGVVDRLVDAQNKTRLTQVTFSPLRRGVIVDFDYQWDHFLPQPQGPCTWGQFFLQTAPPCRRRRYTAAIAEPFKAEVQVHQGAERPTERTVNEYRVYQWERHNVAGIEWDAWTPPLRDFAAWLDFTTLPSWEPVAAQFRKEMGPQPSFEVRELARQLTRDAASPRQKLQAIYRYTTDQVRYGRPPHEMFLPASRTANKMFEDLRGDCKDKSTLMAALLRASGIEAEIVVVATRMQGVAPLLPAARFNHALVIAKLENQVLWLDAAAGPLTCGDMPFQDQGIHGLIVSDQSCDYIQTPAPRPEHHGVSWLCQGRLNGLGEYDFHLQYTARGERASWLRLAFAHRDVRYRDRTLRQTLTRGMPGAVVNAVRASGIDDITQPLHCDCDVRLPGCAQLHEKLWMIRLPWVEPAFFDGPLAADERPQPLTPALPQEILERHEIELPEDFDAEFLGECRHECFCAHYEKSVQLEGNRLTCERRLSFVDRMVPSDRFAEVREFWAACVRADAAAVILARRQQ